VVAHAVMFAAKSAQPVLSRVSTGRKHAAEALAVRTMQLEMVRDISEEITQELDLATLLDLIVRRGVGMVGTASGVLYLASFADQAAIAIENARLYEALEARLARFQVLTRLNQLISASLDMDEGLREIATAAATLMDAAFVRIRIADTATQTLELRTGSNAADASDHPFKTVRFGEGVVGWVAMHRQPLHIPDVFLELVCGVQPDIPDALIGDPGRLRQVLVNLVGNAIKFTERGEVVVAVQQEAQAHSGAPAADEEIVLHFSVRDTG
jgi:signal transduction histidine kinase